MCGIAGIVDFRRKIEIHELKQMCETLAYRGPDDEGYALLNIANKEAEECYGRDTNELFKRGLRKIEESDFFANVALSHRRLSILGQFSYGHQPATIPNANIWVTYNGEIYNYKVLRDTLIKKGHNFTTDTDIEVLLHSYKEWGFGCVEKFNGIWSFAIWDGTDNILFCARDRFGVKPFYYSYYNDRFVFASEIKALLKKRDIKRQPNNPVIFDYLSSGMQDHTEETFFSDIKQLRPGHFLVLQKRGIGIKQYYIPSIEVNRSFTEKECFDKMRFILEDSLRLRTHPNLNYGLCLSGGIDSSALACLAQGLNKKEGNSAIQFPLKAIHVTFKETSRDYYFAKIVAEKTNAQIHLVNPLSKEVPELIGDLVYYQDEPFGSLCVFAQWMAIKKARELNIDVLFDGSGGDELFAGYDEFFVINLLELLKGGKVSSFFREMCFVLQDKTVSLPTGVMLHLVTRSLLPKALFNTISVARLKKNNLIFNQNFLSRYLELPKYVYNSNIQGEVNNFSYNNLIFFPFQQYNHWVDRCYSFFGVESIAPFLDHRVVEFIWSLPNHFKIRNGKRKYILKASLKDLLPFQLLERTDKIGFNVPNNTWLREDLNDWAMSILDSESFNEREYFDANKVRHTFSLHCQGKADFTFILWRCIILELWLRKFFA